MPASLHAQKSGVAVTVNEAAHRVDIAIDGQPFTSYLWQTNQRKPILYRSSRPTDHAHPRQSAPARRTHRPSPPRRPLVQLLQRQQHRLLEQLRRHQARGPRQIRLHRPRPHRLFQERPHLRRARHRIHLVPPPTSPLSAATSSRPSSTRPRVTSSPGSPSRASPPAPST